MPVKTRGGLLPLKTPERWERLMSKIDVRWPHECWNWRDKPNDTGYGRLFIFGEGTFLAHRLMWSWSRDEEIPDGLTIDHLCRNRLCQNPTHMEPVPHVVNTMRGESPAAIHARKTACKRGHPFTDENTYINPASGARVCLTCTEAHRQRQIPAGDHLCDECERSFGSRRGLSIHRAQAHVATTDYAPFGSV